MRKLILVFLTLFFIGAGCTQIINDDLDSSKLRSALAESASELGWSEDVMERQPDSVNYLKSYTIYGQSRQSLENTLDTNVNGLEILEYESVAGAADDYTADQCFKGSGQPLKIFGTDACCLNDAKNGSNVVVMEKENFIFRTYDYFHYNCGGKEFLKKFWEIYNSK